MTTAHTDDDQLDNPLFTRLPDDDDDDTSGDQGDGGDDSTGSGAGEGGKPEGDTGAQTQTPPQTQTQTPDTGGEVDVLVVTRAVSDMTDELYEKYPMIGKEGVREIMDQLVEKFGSKMIVDCKAAEAHLKLARMKVGEMVEKGQYTPQASAPAKRRNEPSNTGGAAATQRGGNSGFARKFEQEFGHLLGDDTKRYTKHF